MFDICIICSSPCMNTWTDVRLYQRVIKRQHRSFIKYFTWFDNNTNAFRQFTAYIFTMGMPLQLSIYNPHKELRLSDFYLMSTNSYTAHATSKPIVLSIFKDDVLTLIYVKREQVHDCFCLQDSLIYQWWKTCWWHQQMVWARTS